MARANRPLAETTEKALNDKDAEGVVKFSHGVQERPLDRVASLRVREGEEREAVDATRGKCWSCRLATSLSDGVKPEAPSSEASARDAFEGSEGTDAETAMQLGRLKSRAERLVVVVPTTYYRDGTE